MENNFAGIKWPSRKEFVHSTLNSYSQIFFSDHLVFGGLLLLTTFLFPLSGLAGLLAVISANLMAYGLGFDSRKTGKGLWGYNVLLTTLPLGLFFEPGVAFWILVLVVSMLTFLVTVGIQGILAKYELPFLSMPFVLVMWILILSTRQFEALHINRVNIFQLNELYGIGGTWLVGFYEWFQNLPVGAFVKAYLTSFSAIFFQNSLAGGLLIVLGLLIASRISFVLSILGFSAAYGFYMLMGLGISESDYAYIGFNFMLTAIALGGFYTIPTKTSFFWVLILTPIVALFTVGCGSFLMNWQLSIYALPFNITTLLFLYAMKWRYQKGRGLQEVPVQRNSPEKNLYAFQNYQHRFGDHRPFQIALPFWGEWFVSQGFDGEITHRGDWRHAWDFVLLGEDGRTYKDQGVVLSDYFAWAKPVLAPANGYVVEVLDGIPDNPVGEVNLKNNWGNTVIIKLEEGLYAKLSHLKKGSIQVKKGDWIARGSQVAGCGNSGRSPEPHLHFQLQTTPYIDSRTLEYPIACFLTRQPEGFNARSYAIPKQGELIKNPEPIVLLQKLFSFIPGQSLSIESSGTDELNRVVWEVKTTPFNESYLECKSSGAKAYYQLDGPVFYFVHFEGPRKTALYHFYLAFFQVPLFYGQNTTIQDQFPQNRVFSRFSLFFQDFLAPFVLYLMGRFSMELAEKQDILGTDSLRIRSGVKRCIFEQTVQAWNFESGFSDSGIELKGISGKEIVRIKWER